MTIMVGAGGGGRGTRPPSRPAYRPPPSVPIRTLVNPVPYSRGNVPIRQVVNPVTPYRPPARSGGIAHAIGGAVREVSHALAPVARSAANSTRSPASATTQRLARALGSPRPQLTPAQKTSLATNFYMREPTSKLGEYAAYTGSQGLRNSTYQSYFDQVFRNLQNAGLISKRAAEPTLSFPAPGKDRIADTGSSYTTGQHITISPLAVGAVAGPFGRQFAGYGKETAVHELAHTQQNPRLLAKYPADQALVEGGAQAFADAASFAAGTGPIPQQDGAYSGYVQQVRRRGPGYYMRGQFGQPLAVAASPRPPHRRNR